MPDDWTYQHCSLIANAIATDYPDATGASDIDECELCNPLVDIYNADLTRWLASHLDNLALCDEAQSEGLVPEDADMCKRISVGQYVALTRICDALCVAIENAPIHLLKTRGGSQCGEVGATDADITCVTCDECLKQHDAITCDAESDVQL